MAKATKATKATKVAMMLKDLPYSFRHKGFTTIELVVVIILLGIMSASVFSRFSGSSGFSEYTYQARLISALRNMQTRAMFDTRDDYCFQINFNSAPPAFGPPTLSYTSGAATDTCQTSIDFTNSDYLTTSATEMSGAEVNITTLPSFGFIAFNGLGQPIDAAGELTCSSSCKIILTAESDVSVCVEAQGYIHACN